jgi:hypothetical protein
MFFRRFRRWPSWKWRVFLGFTFAATGLAFLVIATGLFVFEAAFVDRSIAVQGEVIANIEQQTAADPATNTPASTCFRPQFQYLSANGHTHTAVSSICSNPAGFAAGELVGVRYSRLNESNAQIDSFGEEWGFALVFGLVALLLFPSGYFLLNRVRKQGHAIDLISLWE